jgi:enoyl-CoA hydratase/carnithine racemase
MVTLIDNTYFRASKRDQLAIITFKSRIFDLITSVEDSQVMMDFLRQAEMDKEVKALMLLNQPGCLGEEAYDEFLHKILNKEDLGADLEFEAIAERTVRFRQLTILNRFVRYLANYQKLYFAGMNCQIVTPFIGVALVADFRYASKNASFSFAHNKYGLHPSGGLPFFMTHYL